MAIGSPATSVKDTLPPFMLGRAFTVRARIWLVLGAAALPSVAFTLLGVGSTVRAGASAWGPLLLMLLSLVTAGLALEYLVLRWIRKVDFRVGHVKADPAILAQPLSAAAPLELAMIDAAATALARQIATVELSLEEANSQKEVLLREVHHRVKNSMQIVASLLSLHSSRITDSASTIAFRAALARVNALASIHREIYASGNIQEIDLGAFMTGLVAHTARSESGRERVRLTVESEVKPISSAIALPLGMLMLELIEQALDSDQAKPGATPTVGVAIRSLGGSQISMALHYPVAIAEWKAAQGDSSLGQTLVAAYVRQLRASFETNILDTESFLSVRLALVSPGGALT